MKLIEGSLLKATVDALVDRGNDEDKVMQWAESLGEDGFWTFFGGPFIDQIEDSLNE